MKRARGKTLKPVRRFSVTQENITYSLLPHNSSKPVVSASKNDFANCNLRILCLIIERMVVTKSGLESIINFVA